MKYSLFSCYFCVDYYSKYCSESFSYISIVCYQCIFNFLRMNNMKLFPYGRSNFFNTTNKTDIFVKVCVIICKQPLILL